jgi:hypothetical protein
MEVFRAVLPAGRFCIAAKRVFEERRNRRSYEHIHCTAAKSVLSC